jgi:response regulator RpfG family c-di-GMP phosphodiesterase
MTMIDQAPPTSYEQSPVRVANLILALSSLAHSLRQFRLLLMRADSRLRVLIVGGSAHARSAYRKLLGQEHDVLEASSFADALVLIATGVFDAVIADEQMGAVDSGAFLLAEVRDRWPFVRRVLCTKSITELESRLEAGIAHRLLARPVERAALLASLR